MLVRKEVLVGHLQDFLVQGILDMDTWSSLRTLLCWFHQVPTWNQSPLTIVLLPL
jgi:hypothetical protein